MTTLLIALRPWPPTLWLALALCLLCLILFACWQFFDASFANTLDLALIDLRIRPHPGIPLLEEHQWSRHGPRLLLFFSLALLASSSFGFAVARLFVGSPAERSIGGLLLMTAIVAAWLGLFGGSSKIREVGFLRRVDLAVHGDLKLAAAALDSAWPTGDGELPGIGRYRHFPSDPWIISPKRPEDVQLSEGVEPFIRRMPSGALIFDWGGSLQYRVERHPAGQKPASFADVFAGGDELPHKLLGSREIGDGWWLAWYDDLAHLDLDAELQPAQ